MALGIVAATPAAADSLPDITKSSRWFCDIYSGTAEALIAADLITRAQLQPQKGRQPGVTAFHAHGEPCQAHLRVWRDPGYKVIRQQDDGSLCVEVTVSREMQAWRRKAEKAAEHEREQQQMDKALSECGPEYRNWKLQHGYRNGQATWQADYEWWEGTKEQLQREGIGGGMLFPGEPGGPEELHCKCALGFDVRVYLPGSTQKAAARIYTAQSWYVPHTKEAKQYVQHAPGVMREVWRPSGWRGRDFYYGKAEALIAAGLVPSLHLFPGRSGMNKQQASYRQDWTPATSSPHMDFGATIRRRGKGNEFCLELAVSDAEEKRREHVCMQRDTERSERAKVLAAEREQLRQAVQPETTAEEFRARRAELGEFWLKMIWKQVFANAEGALSFEVPEGSALREDLARAFQTIRDAVQEADIVRDKKQVVAAQTRLKLVAARNDTGLQSVLEDAKRLRLVRTAPGDGAPQ
ncbi:hypothetical protein [Ramlibacter sp.]|uniref:hypothetical protein n=1 Tax=Ramlibacter sp. TaxID=1917967 RepID=UPI002603B640|nr:hypothetical protein [Ramlibacter sp.]MDB5956745.1 hypothetical protein [Ramlibacter sp.]